MKKELNPVIVFAIIGVAAVAVVVAGFIMLGPKSFKEERTGSEADMKRVQQGEPMYRPPAGIPGMGGPPGGAPPPGAPGPGMAPGAPMGR